MRTQLGSQRWLVGAGSRGAVSDQPNVRCEVVPASRRRARTQSSASDTSPALRVRRLFCLLS